VAHGRGYPEIGEAVSRAEFSKPVKREALKRSGGLCEAVGELYGLPASQRCNAPLGYGVEFDHVLLAANGGDNSLGNCAAVCKRCHSHKTRTHDTPVAAKTVRQQDKLGLGIKPRSSFPKPPPGSRWDWKMGRRVFDKEQA
jgi:5-methylcytosine-specific restriction endonuclease McrA